MALYAIADLHLSLGTDKPMDVFGALWENYTEKIAQGWNSVVREDDTVVIAGDLSWAMTAQQSLPDLEFVNRLNGKKIIAKGNHDFWWSTLSKLNAFLLEHGLDTISFLYNNAVLVDDIAVCGTRGWNIFGTAAQDSKILSREAQRFKISCEAAAHLSDKRIAFLHYPPLSAGSEENDMIRLMHEYNITRCYYGHLHCNGLGRAFIGQRFGIDFDIVSADVVHFTPIPVKRFSEEF